MFKCYSIILSVCLFAFAGSKEETIYESSDAVVITKKGEANNVSADRIARDLVAVRRIVNHKTVLQKKKMGSDHDTIKLINRLSTLDYITNKSLVSVGEQGVNFFHRTIKKSRKRTKEEMKFYNETKKLPKSWAVVDTNIALGTARDFLEDAVRLDALEYYDSIEVANTDECYVFRFRVRQKRNICEHRVVTVWVNANAGYVEYFRVPNRAGYTDLEPEYAPKVTFEQAQQILIKYGEEIGKTIRFESMPEAEEATYDKVRAFCLKPKNTEDVLKENVEGWMWHAFIRREPSILFQKNEVFIDSETGEILYSDF